MNKKVKTRELFLNVPPYLSKLFDECEYPWQIVPRIRELASALVNGGLEGYTLLRDGVLVGEGVRIYQGAVIEGPTVIGSGTELRPGAFIRGGVIVGEGCVIGNSSELKNCIILDKVQIPHYNYIGDSILGERAHTGAGAICSNLRSDGRSVTVHADVDYDTGLRKLGAILADGVEIGCGAVLNPGTVIGRNTTVYPLTSLRGVYPADSIIKATDVVVPRQK